MPPQAATGIFAISRTAGWIAHAAEEYTEPYLRFRGRRHPRPQPTANASLTLRSLRSQV
jgi:citrate synthase